MAFCFEGIVKNDFRVSTWSSRVLARLNKMALFFRRETGRDIPAQRESIYGDNQDSSQYSTLESHVKVGFMPNPAKYTVNHDGIIMHSLKSDLK